MRQRGREREKEREKRRTERQTKTLGEGGEWEDAHAEDTQGRASARLGRSASQGIQPPGRAMLEARLQGWPWSLMSVYLILSLLGQEDSGW